MVLCGGRGLWLGSTGLLGVQLELVPQVWSLGALWLSGHKSSLLWVVQPGGPFSMMGGARGWVPGRAGLWGVPRTWVWVVGTSPQILGHPTSICDTGVNVKVNNIKKYLQESEERGGVRE